MSDEEAEIGLLKHVLNKINLHVALDKGILELSVTKIKKGQEGRVNSGLNLKKNIQRVIRDII